MSEKKEKNPPNISAHWHQLQEREESTWNLGAAQNILNIMIIKTTAEPGVLPQLILANILLETLRSDDPDGDIPRRHQGSIVYLCNRGSFVEN